MAYAFHIFENIECFCFIYDLKNKKTETFLPYLPLPKTKNEIEKLFEAILKHYAPESIKSMFFNLNLFKKLTEQVEWF